jgi:hypothetical protein
MGMKNCHSSWSQPTNPAWLMMSRLQTPFTKIRARQWHDDANLFVHHSWDMCSVCFCRFTDVYPQAAGGTLIGEDRLIVMAGTAWMEWYQTHHTPGVHVFNTIPFSPFQPLFWVILPSAASCAWYNILYCNGTLCKRKSQKCVIITHLCCCCCCF